MSAALALPPLAKPVATSQTQAFEPGSINEAMQLATLLVASRLLPKSVATPEAAFAIIATGRELGLTAMQSLRTIHVIEGKPTLSADLVAALVKSRRDVCVYFMMVESTHLVARYETQRVGEPKPTAMAFTIEDAQRAGVTGKDNWRKYPAAMLRARCITALARAVYPDLAMGVYDEDELEPVHVPNDRRVWVEPDKEPIVDASMFEALSERVDRAESPNELNLVAKDCMRARREGLIGDAHVDLIAAGVKSKRVLIGAHVPPSSEPRVVEREPGEEG